MPNTIPHGTDLRTEHPIDRRSLRGALGTFATGVTVITTKTAAGDYAGFTANSFSSVSLDPPLVLWSLGLHSPNLAVFQNCSHFAISILSAEQADISQRFATAGIDKFAGLDVQEGLGGAPLIPGCCAWFECANEARHPGGDHLIFVGRVLRFARQNHAPRLFHAGQYRHLAAE